MEVTYALSESNYTIVRNKVRNEVVFIIHSLLERNVPMRDFEIILFIIYYDLINVDEEIDCLCK